MLPIPLAHHPAQAFQGILGLILRLAISLFQTIGSKMEFELALTILAGFHIELPHHLLHQLGRIHPLSSFKHLPELLLQGSRLILRINALPLAAGFGFVRIFGGTVRRVFPLPCEGLAALVVLHALAQSLEAFLKIFLLPGVESHGFG